MCCLPCSIIDPLTPSDPCQVYNEPQGCHGITPETYNEQYDAVTAAIRKMADPEHK